jgi:hypothetical protein
MPLDINRASILTEEVETVVDDMFEYHKWTDSQIEAGVRVRKALIAAFKVIIADVPPSPDRTVALRKLRDARADCNSAITHGGKY